MTSPPTQPEPLAVKQVDEPEWLTVPQMAADLSVSQSKVRTWCRNGLIAAVNIGDNERSFYRAKRSEWERFKATRTKAAAGPRRFRQKSGTNLLGI